MPSPVPDRPLGALRHPLRTAAAALGLLLAPGCSPAQTPAPDGATAGVAGPVDDRAVAGVTTHFSQGWPRRLIADARGLGVTMARDSLHWSKIETAPGRYAFTDANAGHLAALCDQGIPVLLALEPRNPLYDRGQTAYSPAAQTAFAAYVKAIADRWPDCVTAIEIGNEINGTRGMTGPAARDRINAHVSLLRRVHAAVKPGHPGLVLIGGSTNAVGTGMLRQLMAAGMAEWVDAIAIHPYRIAPEGLDWELAHLRTVLAQSGTPLPIWATEFSRDFATPDEAAPFLVKMVALMNGQGIGHHFWYALADEPAFPTMGLTRFDSTRKPAGEAFAFLARTLFPAGPGVRVDHGLVGPFHYRFGADAHIIWGGARRLLVPPGTRAYSPTGEAIPVPAEVSDTPVILRQAATVDFGPPLILADSLYGFGSAPLAWYIRLPNGKLLPTSPIDTRWASYLGVPGAPLTAINPAGLGASPARASVVRYTASEAASGAIASFCLVPIGLASAGIALLRNDIPVWQGSAQGTPLSVSVPVPIAAGDRIDLVVGNRPVRAGRFRYRFRISRSTVTATDCSTAGIGASAGAPAPAGGQAQP